MKKNIFTPILLGILALFLVGWGTGVLIYTEYLWFKEVGFTQIYLKILLTKVYLGLIFGFVFFAFLYGNLLIVRKLTPIWRVAEEKILESIRTGFSKRATLILLGIGLFFSLIAASSAPSKWDIILRYFNQTTFGLKDPLFHRDIAFYQFTLPIYRYLYQFLVGLLSVTLLAVLATHFFNGGITWNVFRRKVEVAPGSRAHLSILVGLIFFLKAWDYLLRQYELVYSSRGAVFGASYTDISAQLPVLKFLVVIAIFSGALFLINIYFKSFVLPISGAILLVVTSSVGGSAYPALIQRFLVAPNEIAKEKKFINYNIDYTRKAYGLDKIKEQMFPVKETLQQGDLEKNKGTINNIRLWDWRPLKKTYSQLQEIRLYYTFKDIDVDRYFLDGEYRQILLSAREMSVQQLPAKAKTWVNAHLTYTHGYGAALSPASEVSPEGLPNFLVKDIPPTTNTAIKIRRPEIYYGEEPDSYVVVKTKTKEFDYPKGDKNVYATYRGKGGIPLSTLFRKTAFSWKFSSLQLFLSGAITPESRILFRRQIQTRVKTVAPFLKYDSDPYLVVSKGRLFWIMDGYTISDRYPYSEPFEGRNNYIRNSVKVVIDAYNGDLTFYISDRKDPLIQTYRKIFPSLFKPFNRIPEDLRAHLRYPLDFFKIQAGVYGTYHMRDPQVFYNKEDQWDVPMEIFGGTEQRVEPYYIIMRLPGETREKFLLLLPFTPASKNNMISWLSANSDFPNYGELLVYKFPKQKLVFGPEQIEARINQDPEISRQFTLWGQRGSEVIRGNLLVIPIEESLLYVEPLYLQAERGELPELTQVIVSYSNRIAMEDTLDKSLQMIFAGKPGERAETKAAKEEGTEEGEDVKTLIERAADQLNQALEKQKEGDWAGYGEQIKRLEGTLKSLREKSSIK